MQKIKKLEMKKLICISLCVIALIGFLLPAVNINMDFMGNTRSTSIGLTSVFNRSDSQFGGMDMSQADLFNLSGEGRFSEMFAEVSGKVFSAVGAFLLTILLLVITLVFTILDKLKKPVNVMLVAAIGLFIYAGVTIMSVKDTLLAGLQGSLGFIGMLFNVSDMIKISLGGGYWLTMIFAWCLLLTNAVYYFWNKSRLTVN